MRGAEATLALGRAANVGSAGSGSRMPESEDGEVG